MRYFDTTSNQLHKDLFRQEYQEHYFDKIFKTKKGMLTAIEYLDFGYKIEAQHSFALLLSIIDSYYCRLLENLQKPLLCYNQSKLILDNTTINQLNILDVDTTNIHDYRAAKFKSVFQVINFTRTKIGHRYLKNRITNPEVDINIINDRYKKCGEMIEGENYKNVLSILNYLPDFERLHRKIMINKIKLKDFYVLNDGYKHFKKFYTLESLPLMKKFLDTNLDKKALKKYISTYKKKFNVGNMDVDGFLPLNNIFTKGLYKDLDLLYTQRGSKKDIYTIVRDKFQNFFHSVVKTYKQKDKFVKIKINKKSVTLKMTEHKYRTLMANKLELTKFTIKVNQNIYSLADFEIRKKGKEYEIHHDILIYKDIEELETNIQSLTKKYFLEIIKELSKQFGKLYDAITNITGEIDFTYSNAKCAVKNNYFCPELEEKKQDSSYFEIENMRHPIIEKLCDNVYKPFDLTINSNKLGLILSGLNAVGKSSMLKTVGIIITLAQMGYYVPCTKLKLGVFKQIMTRIVGNDNILTNSSSYQIEMKELRSILNRANENTLVLVDELCRGTEHNSSVSLTVATIEHFSKVLKNRFLITTHMHKIFDYISDLDNVLIKHISIKCENGKLIYDRNLVDGPSPTNYGLMVAEVMGIDIKVLSRAEKVRKDLLQSSG